MIKRIKSWWWMRQNMRGHAAVNGALDALHKQITPVYGRYKRAKAQHGADSTEARAAAADWAFILAASRLTLAAKMEAGKSYDAAWERGIEAVDLRGNVKPCASA